MKELEDLFKKVQVAFEEFSHFSQEKVDYIFKMAALAANENRIYLAKLAKEETKMGIVEDKILKNHYASEFIYNKYKNLQTVGTFMENEPGGLEKVYEPIGVVGAVIPTTNPTATAIFKCLLCLKTRNAIIISPHPGAKKCTVEAARIVLEAAVKAGAPKNIIGWIESPSLEGTEYVMKNSNIILATGGPGMVKAAYSSGVPAIGVGAGNAPAIIDDTANIELATSSIVQSNTFDNGVVCATENSVIVLESIYDKVVKSFEKKNTYIVTKEEEKNKFRKSMFKEGKFGLLNAELVGRSALEVANLVGIKVPETTRFILVEAERTDHDEALAHEKLSTYATLYKAKNFDDAIKKAEDVLKLGPGHTASLFINRKSSVEKIDKFKTLNPGRLLINSPSSLGGVGDMYNFILEPSLTLGCGTKGGNSFSQNVTPLNLLNVKSLVERRENMQWLRLPEKIYHKYGSLEVALEDLKDWNINNVFIVTDKVINKLYGKRLTSRLDELKIKYTIFDDVEPNPMLSTTLKGAKLLESLKADAIIGIGGGSSMDAAKLMWLYYESEEEIDFKDLAVTFADIRKRIVKYPLTGRKSKMICIPTTSGTGSEVTPFSVITDDQDHKKYPLADYSLTPNMAIIDPSLTMTVPKGATNAPALDALTHCMESYVSVMSTDYTDSYALQGAKNIFEYLPRAYKDGSTDKEAREKVMNGAAFAGISFANAFLGIVHSLSHKVGGYHNVIHGAANAILLPYVIRYNAACVMEGGKQGYFSQYETQNSMEKYANMAKFVGVKGKSDEELVDSLIEKIQTLTKEVELKSSFKDYGVDEQAFLNSLDKMSEDAFDDQCTGANPRYPLIEDIKKLYLDAYYGKEVQKLAK
ncbi:bifunctional acetaldehyde-CoA/alcohol dehydrogenase [Spiroplasma turonicum]|uniref:Aldehyde-alcohol dehydrogenase n=1 Tax=Spiroplasma turonicum TaxID=216946 RepID=A0A0K1P4W4_9MOLU|nr:bifunctional acetaldehyde-CoA/alcohol dehydrogenase [Spiroplasma turonicum]AKU79333.1 acetaldehyde dehydrogenase / alcohol dehydrogenase [Spiroplasma turonicum]ALX70354.1 acetaldehyde dehydrogenase [Spiroplasma turonicum]